MRMKWMMIGVLALTGCASKTDFGKCVGLNGFEEPGLRYEWSARNIVLGIFFFEIIAPPIFVVLDQAKCPVGFK